jgi:hypothetical protein
MADQGKNGPLPSWEVYDHPIYGKVVRDNFALNHPTEELLRHRGRYVAWSMDGSVILASASNMGDLFAEVDRLGLNGGNYTVDYVTEDV